LSSGSGKQEKRQAHYSLTAIQLQFSESDGYIIPGSVARYMAKAGWDESDVKACVLCLDDKDLFKSQAHDTRPGVWLDIYKPVYEGELLYVKFTKHEDGRTVILLSFCRDGDEH